MPIDLIYIIIWLKDQLHNTSWSFIIHPYDYQSIRIYHSDVGMQIYVIPYDIRVPIDLELHTDNRMALDAYGHLTVIQADRYISSHMISVCLSTWSLIYITIWLTDPYGYIYHSDTDIWMYHCDVGIQIYHSGKGIRMYFIPCGFSMPIDLEFIQISVWCRGIQIYHSDTGIRTYLIPCDIRVPIDLELH